jgi:hypothetical protein
MSEQTRKVRLTTRSSWQEFRDALIAPPSPFSTSGSLEGRYTQGQETAGQLPEEYQGSFGDADYAVFSYDTPIAWRIDGQWYMPDYRYSRTTTRHQSTIRVALEQGPGIAGTGKSR